MREGIEVRPVSSPAEFHALDSLYQNSFGSSAVPTEILKNWWTNFPQGLIIILKSGNIIGGVSVWSIDDSTFDKLKRGYIKERDILVSQIDRKTLNKWYISEIVLIEEERNLFNLIMLIDGILSQLVIEIKTDYPAHLLALGYSNEGVALMTRFGFIKEVDDADTADKLPLFERIINSEKDLSDLRIKLNALYNSKLDSTNG